MDLERKLSELSDEEAEQALQALLKNLVTLEPEYEVVITSPARMQAFLREASAEVEIAPRPVGEPEPEVRARVVRAALAEAAADPELRASLENYLEHKRDLLLEPVTTAIVLASIVLVLSTHVKLDIRHKHGQAAEWQLKIEKKPTAESLLKKFFGILG